MTLDPSKPQGATRRDTTGPGSNPGSGTQENAANGGFAVGDGLQADSNQPDAGSTMTRHQQIVRALVDAYDCQAGGGFARQLRHIPSDEMEDDRRFLNQRWPIPDAWRFDYDARELVIYEVEDTHPMTDEVLAGWTLLWHFLDTYDWTMRLVRVARWGQCDEVQLGLAYVHFHLLSREVTA